MVDLAQAKLHLRVDYGDEDALIQQYIDAATGATADYLNWESIPDPMPAPVTAAILLAVGDLYEHREGKTDSRLVDNDTYLRLLNPYRLMNV